MYRSVEPVHRQKLAEAFDLPAAEVTADVILVVVRDENARQAQAVGTEDVDELAHAIRGIDGHRLAPLTIADEVAVVGHLARDRVVAREVVAGEQLLEVEAIVHVEVIHGGRRASIRNPTGHVASCAPGR